jgi:multisubunit Na+/H+ antiporter MnhB subunit
MSNDMKHEKHPEDKSEFTEEQQYKFSNPDYIQSRKKLGSSIIIYTVLRPLTFFILIFAFYVFWNGHNAPGGGFIAGLMTAACIVLLYVNYGSDFIRKNLSFDSKYLIAIGLSCSMYDGLGAVVFGYPFLTQAFGHINFPFLESIELTTALIFDFGVFLVVTGGCLTIITSIGQSDFKAANDNEPASAQEKRLVSGG